jgi:hypothetical protein
MTLDDVKEAEKILPELLKQIDTKEANMDAFREALRAFLSSAKTSQDFRSKSLQTVMQAAEAAGYLIKF